MSKERCKSCGQRMPGSWVEILLLPGNRIGGCDDAKMYFQWVSDAGYAKDPTELLLFAVCTLDDEDIAGIRTQATRRLHNADRVMEAVERALADITAGAESICVEDAAVMVAHVMSRVSEQELYNNLRRFV